MTENDDLRRLLQQVLPPVEERSPGHHPWPAVLARRRRAPRWTWLDLGAAAALAILLSLFPGCLWLLLYHL